jgi:hypothetical protein
VHATTSCHASLSFEPCLPVGVGSGTATRPMVLDPASLLGRALALPHISWLRTPLPYWGGLWRCHASHGSGPRSSIGEGSSAATCHMAPDAASPLGRAPALPRAPWFPTTPPHSGGPQRCHMSHSSLRAACLRNKERSCRPSPAN